MRFRCLILLITLFFTSCISGSKQPFTGTWSRIYTNESGEAISSFCLVLEQDGDKISGYHFRVLAKGSRIDESASDDSIEGSVENGVAMITIQSGRGAKIAGRAKLEIIQNDSIKFTLIKEPTQGDHALPSEMTLPKSCTQ